MLKNWKDKLKENWIDLQYWLNGNSWCYGAYVKAIIEADIVTVRALDRKSFNRRGVDASFINVARRERVIDGAMELVRLGMEFSFKDLIDMIAWNETFLVMSMLKKKPEHLEKRQDADETIPNNRRKAVIEFAIENAPYTQREIPIDTLLWKKKREKGRTP